MRPNAVTIPTESVVLVLGSGMQRYREYLLSSAAGRHDIWLFNITEPDWQKKYVVGSDVLDLYDLDLTVNQAKELSQRVDVVGVLSWDETLVVAAAHVAQALGLPGPTVEGIEGCRDKHRNRTVLAAAGLAAPRSTLVYSAEEAVRAADETGYPVVVKPRGMGASIGVVMAGDAGAVDAAFRIAEDSSQEGAHAYRGGALVEEFLDGPEISIDGVVTGGEWTPLYLARKQIDMHPYFEEVGHVVDPSDPQLHDAGLRDMVAAAHRAIGFRDGMTHTEVMLTGRGPVIVEINGRLGGDMIPYVGRLATGVDPAVVAVDVAIGRTPDLTGTVSRTVGIRFGYPPFDCVVEKIETPGLGQVEGLLESGAIATAGTTLRLPPGDYIARHSYVICTGTDAESCEARLHDAVQRVRLDARPLNSDRAV